MLVSQFKRKVAKNQNLYRDNLEEHKELSKERFEGNRETS